MIAYLFPIMLVLVGQCINVALIAIVVSFIKIVLKVIIQKGGHKHGYFASNPLFGIVLSIWAYLIGMLIFTEYPHPITTPLSGYVSLSYS